MRKKIEKCIRDRKRSRRQEKIQRILEEFKGIENMSNIKPARKRTPSPKVKNEKDEVITSRKGIANIFGEWYGKLYADDPCEETELDIDKSETENDKRDQSSGGEEMTEIPQFKTEEFQAAIDRLKKRESRRQQRNQSRRHQNM